MIRIEESYLRKLQEFEWIVTRIAESLQVKNEEVEDAVYDLIDKASIGNKVLELMSKPIQPELFINKLGEFVK